MGEMDVAWDIRNSFF